MSELKTNQIATNDGSSGGLTVNTSTSGSKRIYEFTAGTGTITF